MGNSGRIFPESPRPHPKGNSINLRQDKKCLFTLKTAQLPDRCDRFLSDDGDLLQARVPFTRQALDSEDLRNGKGPQPRPDVPE